MAGQLFIPDTHEEAVCTVEDISPKAAAIQCDLKQEPRGRAILDLDGLGRLDGPIVRRASGGFVIMFNCSQQQREKLADQLTLELNRHLLAESDLRRHDRIEAAAGSYTLFTRSTGELVHCEVLDRSLTGVSV